MVSLQKFFALSSLFFAFSSAVAIDAERQEWLSRIKDDPNNDELRLNYADWLDSTGHPFQEARLIRVQIRLRGRTTRDVQTMALLAEEKSLTSFLNRENPRITLYFDRGIATKALLHQFDSVARSVKDDAKLFETTTLALLDLHPLLRVIEIDYLRLQPSVEIRDGLSSKELRHRFISVIRPIIHPSRRPYEDEEEEEGHADCESWLRYLGSFP